MNDKIVARTGTEDMSERAKELRRNYNREWARKNRDRRNAINRAYWERKATRLAAEQSEGGVSDGNE